MLVAQSCLTLCDSMNCSPLGFSVHEIFQARILEWVAISSPGDLPHPGIKPTSPVSPALAGRFFTTEPWGKPLAWPSKPSAPESLLPAAHPQQAVESALLGLQPQCCANFAFPLKGPSLLSPTKVQGQIQPSKDGLALISELGGASLPRLDSQPHLSET